MSYRSLMGATSLPSQLELSHLESARFGFSIGRIELSSTALVTPDDIRDLVIRGGLDITVVRYNASAVDWFSRFLAPELVVLHADTLLYYGLDMGTRPSPATDDRFTARTATEEDVPVVRAMVAEMFATYGHHYAANPLLSRHDALEGYQEWVASFFESDGTGREVLVLEDAAGSPAALATLLTEDPSEIVLGGIDPAFRGQGVYPALLGECERELASKGCHKVHISTQAHNRSVMRTWSDRGYRFEMALQTVHLIRRDTFDRTLGHRST